MKFVFDDEVIKIYVPKEYKQIDKDNFEETIKQILLKFSKHYHLNLNGFYTVNVYSDEFYGVIIYMQKEDIDYFDYYDSGIDMRITFTDTEFLYQVDDDIYFNQKDYLDILFLEDKMYAKINKKIDMKQLLALLEMTSEIKV